MNGNEGQLPDREQAGIHPGEIAILCGTRGRPEMFAESLASLRATVRDKARTHLWVYVDEDDAVTRRAIESGAIPDPGLPLHWHIGPRTAGLGQMHQALWNASGPGAVASAK